MDNQMWTAHLLQINKIYIYESIYLRFDQEESNCFLDIACEVYKVNKHVHPYSLRSAEPSADSQLDSLPSVMAVPSPSRKSVTSVPLKVEPKEPPNKKAKGEPSRPLAVKGPPVSSNGLMQTPPHKSSTLGVFTPTPPKKPMTTLPPVPPCKMERPMPTVIPTMAARLRQIPVPKPKPSSKTTAAKAEDTSVLPGAPPPAVAKATMPTPVSPIPPILIEVDDDVTTAPTLDDFDKRLQAELAAEFDKLSIKSPPPKASALMSPSQPAQASPATAAPAKEKQELVKTQEQEKQPTAKTPLQQTTPLTPQQQAAPTVTGEAGKPLERTTPPLTPQQPAAVTGEAGKPSETTTPPLTPQQTAAPTVTAKPSDTTTPSLTPPPAAVTGEAGKPSQTTTPPLTPQQPAAPTVTGEAAKPLETPSTTSLTQQQPAAVTGEAGKPSETTTPPLTPQQTAAPTVTAKPGETTTPSLTPQPAAVTGEAGKPSQTTTPPLTPQPAAVSGEAANQTTTTPSTPQQPAAAPEPKQAAIAKATAPAPEAPKTRSLEDIIRSRLEKLDESQFDARLQKAKQHPSLKDYLIEVAGDETYELGSHEDLEELACFEVWCHKNSIPFDSPSPATVAKTTRTPEQAKAAPPTPGKVTFTPLAPATPPVKAAMPPPKVIPEKTNHVASGEVQVRGPVLWIQW